MWRVLVLAVLVGCGDASPKDSPATAAPDTVVVDSDGDGFEASEDCDDTDAAVHPGATEACNGRDDDCDGTVDGDTASCGTGLVCRDGVCGCVDGFVDCDGDDANGCETALEDRPAEAIEAGCCHPYDHAGNRLDDCDGDGYCECYGACLDGECEGE